MMGTVSWRAWWWDGRQYTSDEYRWEDLPEDGWQAFVLYLDEKPGGPRRRIMMGSTHYFRVETELGVIYGEGNDSEDNIEKRYPGASIKKGKWTTDAVLQQIRVEANEAQQAPAGCKDCG